MFAFKKIVTAFLLPPGLLVMVFITSGLFFVFRKRKRCGLFLLAMGITTWGLSVAPVANFFIRGLTAGYTYPGVLKGDVIILLGGGFHSEAYDLTGKGFPAGDMLARIVTAARLQEKLKIPIIISDRNGLSGSSEGVKITRRLLVDLGVLQRDILLEDRGRDTFENARFSREICEKLGAERPILVTSGFHLKRSSMIFRNVGLEVIPVPAYLIVPERQRYGWYSFLPSARSMLGLSTALHEYLGILYFRMIKNP